VKSLKKKRSEEEIGLRLRRTREATVRKIGHRRSEKGGEHEERGGQRRESIGEGKQRGVWSGELTPLGKGKVSIRFVRGDKGFKKGQYKGDRTRGQIKHVHFYVRNALEGDPCA